jgi:seryl-tRNA synthetase
MRVRVPHPALAGASAAARAGVRADLAFCHPAITGVRAIDDHAVELDVDDGAGEAAMEDLRRQVAQVVALSIASYRFVPALAPLWQHDACARYADDGAGLLAFIAARTLELGPGQYALCGAAAELRASLDARVKALAVGAGAEPWHLPSIEHGTDLLVETGYLASHAQHVTFGYRLPCHFERLRGFAVDARERRLPRPDDARDLEPTGFILEPFVCHNVYRALRGARLPRGRAITALGTCYRHEGFRFEPLLRQWEFSMREVVLVGEPAYVRRERERLLVLTRELAERLDLDARLEIATDPFFVSEAGSARTFQAMQSTKLELTLGLGGDRRVAAASFNLHGRHFTEPMTITGADGEPLETACLGWGLERWMAAIVARWGAEPACWPSALLDEAAAGRDPAGGAGAREGGDVLAR